MQTIFNYALNEAIKQNDTNMIDLCLQNNTIITDKTLDLVLSSVNKNKLLQGIFVSAISHNNMEIINKCLKNKCIVNKKLLEMFLNQIKYCKNISGIKHDEKTILELHEIFNVIWNNISEFDDNTVSNFIMTCVTCKFPKFLETIIKSGYYDKQNHMLLYESLVTNHKNGNYKFLLQNGFDKHINKVIMQLLKLQHVIDDLTGITLLLDFGINIYMCQPEIQHYFMAIGNPSGTLINAGELLVKYMKPFGNNNKNSYLALQKQYTLITQGTLISCLGVYDVSNYIICYYKFLVEITHVNCVHYLEGKIEKYYLDMDEYSDTSDYDDGYDDDSYDDGMGYTRH